MGTADTGSWTEPRDLTVFGAHPTYWLALGLAIVMAVLQ